jgi:small-conductance mechanosensitive channel
MVVSLVRHDMHVYVGALALLINAYEQTWGAFKITASAIILSYAAWWVLEHRDFVEKRGFDMSIMLYSASLTVWCCLAALLYCLAYAAGFTSLVGTPNEQVLLAVTVALGAGVQPILTNFSAGLLLALFRPFRVGDDITVDGRNFTIESITAFFTHATNFENIHLAIPNNKLIEDVVTNFTSNGTQELELPVYVRFSAQRPNEVRQALLKAAEALYARLPEVLEPSAVEAVNAMLASDPKYKQKIIHGPMAITEKGVQWMLKPCVPYEAGYESGSPAAYLCYECMQNALLDAGIEVFELRLQA